MKLAIIEDDIIIQMFLERVASSIHFNVVGTAEDHDQALKLIETTAPDVVLLDIGIRGDVDGIVTAKVIRERFDIPHFFMSGNTDSKTHERAISTNPVGFIIKPIDQFSLRSQLIQIKTTLEKSVETN